VGGFFLRRILQHDHQLFIRQKTGAASIEIPLPVEARNQNSAYFGKRVRDSFCCVALFQTDSAFIFSDLFNSLVPADACRMEDFAAQYLQALTYLPGPFQYGFFR
jgi:hypothetical protein